jgi:aminopeptidase YwaD
MTAVTATAPTEVEALLSRFDLGRARRSLRRLCSKEFAGRRIASPGHDRAQRWLASQFRAFELDVELFAFQGGVEVLDVTAEPRFEVLDEGRLLRYRSDFAEHPRSVSLPDQDELLRWEVLEAVPRRGDFDELASRLKLAGVGGLLVPQYRMDDGYLSKRIVARAPLELPVVSVAMPLLDGLRDRRLRVRLPLRRLPADGAHVIARLAGTNPALAHEPLIVGAHYDGMGDDADGRRLPSAADNAAAVAVILEVARVLASAPPPPRPVFFVAFDGEEVDALGTRVWAASLAETELHPLVINLDLAGRLHDTITVEPGAAPERTLAAMDQAGEWLEQPLAIGAVSSDNRRFAQVGFQSVGIGLGGAAMHSPADTYESVEPKAMLAAGRLLLATLAEIERRSRP